MKTYLCFRPSLPCPNNIPCGEFCCVVTGLCPVPAGQSPASTQKRLAAFSVVIRRCPIRSENQLRIVCRSAACAIRAIRACAMAIRGGCGEDLAVLPTVLVAMSKQYTARRILLCGDGASPRPGGAKPRLHTEAACRVLSCCQEVPNTIRKSTSNRLPVRRLRHQSHQGVRDGDTRRLRRRFSCIADRPSCHVQTIYRAENIVVW